MCVRKKEGMLPGCALIYRIAWRWGRVVNEFIVSYFMNGTSDYVGKADGQFQISSRYSDPVVVSCP